MVDVPTGLVAEAMVMATFGVEVVVVSGSAVGPGRAVVDVALAGGPAAAGEDAGGGGDAEPPSEGNGNAVRLAIEHERRAGHGVGEEPDP